MNPVQSVTGVLPPQVKFTGFETDPLHLSVVEVKNAWS
jgi:hypothetical protein